MRGAEEVGEEEEDREEEDYMYHQEVRTGRQVTLLFSYTSLYLLEDTAHSGCDRLGGHLLSSQLLILGNALSH